MHKLTKETKVNIQLLSINKKNINLTQLEREWDDTILTISKELKLDVELERKLLASLVHYIKNVSNHLGEERQYSVFENKQLEYLAKIKIGEIN